MVFENLDEYYNYLMDSISADAHIEDEEGFIEDKFTEYVIDVMHDADEVENGFVITPGFRSRGVKVNGYDINSQENHCDLIVTNFSHDRGEKIPTLPRSPLDKLFKKGKTFYDKSRIGSTGFEESTDAYDLAKRINSLFGSIDRVRIIVITNCITGNLPAVEEEIDGIVFSYLTWDIERIYRFESSGMVAQPVHIDFVDEIGEPLKCVFVNDNKDYYTTMSGFISANALYSLYDRWGPRLLERNVRAYLQARSKVNKGIKKTIVDTPELFLAFNNGLTITAETIDADFNDDNTCSIKSIRDFQIVNGGQTCASLWHAKEKQNAPLDNINVMLKLSVFKDHEVVDGITPLISRFSNSQNPVNTADFSANDPYHVELSKISLRTFAPDPTGGGQETLWFYERSRGSFDETRNRERTPSRIRKWNKKYPRNQRFDKLLLAKVENTWGMAPHIVSMGAQRNFSEFSVRKQESGKKEVSESEFKRIVARIIIWKTLEKIVSRQQIPGYRANIVTYTLSWFYKKTERKINLDEIWKNQSIDEDMVGIFDEMSRKVREHITDTTYNVTEWCKKEQCWKGLLRRRYSIPDSYKKNLIDTAPDSIEISDSSKEKIETVSNIPASVWKKLSRWAALTDSLEKWERGIAYSIGQRISRGKDPSAKQANHGMRIHKKALELGFNPEDVD